MNQSTALTSHEAMASKAPQPLMEQKSKAAPAATAQAPQQPAKAQAQSHVQGTERPVPVFMPDPSQCTEPQQPATAPKAQAPQQPATAPSGCDGPAAAAASSSGGAVAPTEWWLGDKFPFYNSRYHYLFPQGLPPPPPAVPKTEKMNQTKRSGHKQNAAQERRDEDYGKRALEKKRQWELIARGAQAVVEAQEATLQQLQSQNQQHALLLQQLQQNQQQAQLHQQQQHATVLAQQNQQRQKQMEELQKQHADAQQEQQREHAEKKNQLQHDF